MTHRAMYFLFWILGMFCVALAATAEDTKVWEEVDTLVRGSEGLAETRQLVDAFVQKRAGSVKRLIDVLRDETKTNETRIAAANLLGILRAPEAVEPLIVDLRYLLR